MVIAKGLIAHAVLPLALAAASGGLLAQAGDLQQSAQADYAVARGNVRHALRLDWQPESLAPRSSGEIACWQRRDKSVRDNEVAGDTQGNIYVVDGSKLRVLKLDPGFRLGGDQGDWMSDKLIDKTRNTSHLP
jgi:hypothetical protein